MAQATTSLTIADFDAEWTEGSWSIGHTLPHGHWTAFVHGHGSCESGTGRTAKEAFDKAVSAFRARYPDELTAKRAQLQQARADAERLERELSEQAA